MEGHIISPWLIYFSQVSDGMQIVLGVSSGLSLILVPILGGMACEYDGGWGRFRSQFMKYVVASLVAVLIAVLIPSRATIIGMVVADTVTYEVVGDAHEQVKKDILEIIGALNEDKEDK